MLLEPSFYQQDPLTIARALLGKRLVSRMERKRTSGIIVETEAYLFDDDSACHAVRGKTKSNLAMWGPFGRAYVYPIHAKFCFNVVTGQSGHASAVLIRSLQPDSGLKQMEIRRGTTDRSKLTTGPGRLCQAMAIDRTVDHCDLSLKRKIWIESADLINVEDVMVTPRIGVTSAEDLMLRFVVANNPFVSGPKKWRCNV